MAAAVVDEIDATDTISTASPLTKVTAQIRNSCRQCRIHKARPAIAPRPATRSREIERKAQNPVAKGEPGLWLELNIWGAHVKHNLKALTLSMALFAFAMPVKASNIIGAHVTHIIPNNVGVVAIYLDAPRTGLPSCAGTSTTAFEFNVTTPAGQAMLAALYVAFASNLPVDIQGTSTCAAGGFVETIGYMAVHK
jgi:hypothetical protein